MNKLLDKDLKIDYNNIVYRDNEDYLTDLKELFAYNELTSFNATSYESQRKIFKDDSKNFNLYCEEKKISVIRRLMDQLEMTDANLRMNAVRCILFIAQGCIDGPILFRKRNTNATNNVMLLFRLGVFSTLVELLNVERKSDKYDELAVLYQKPFSGCYNIYIILNILSLIMIHMLNEKRSVRQTYKKDVHVFLTEVLFCEENESLLFILLDMMIQFTMMRKPGFPIKKIIFLIWKIVIFYLGDLKEVWQQKCEKRLSFGLSVDHCNNLDNTEGKCPRPMLHKVTQKDLDCYIYNLYLKGQQVSDSVTSEGITSLKKHLYIPLSDIQMKEKQLPRNENVEMLYENMFPDLLLYAGCLLEIFQACNNQPLVSLACDYDQECLNIFGEISAFHSSVDTFDVYEIYEHVEIINKIITGILLLLLKHFKLNHIYQFEYLCHCMEANDGIQYLTSFIDRTSEMFHKLSKMKLVSECDFERFPVCKPSPRNLFTLVNSLRIINKLIKWKYSRIQTFTLIGSKHLFSLALLQNNHVTVYSLKLLKLVSKYMGRKWRQENMKIMNSVFQKVRHRLLDDWNSGFSNNNEDEEILKVRLRIFNKEYMKNVYTDDIEVTDISGDVDLKDEFKNNYETWLEREVFQNPFDWDLLLTSSLL